MSGLESHPPLGNATYHEHEHNYETSSPFSSAEGPDTDAVMLVIILPIILVVGFITCHCYLSNKRRNEYRERSQVLAAQRAQLRGERGLDEKKLKERMKDIEKALIVKTASKCECNKCSSTKEDIDSISDLTVHTNSTDEISLSSSNHDIENPAIVDNSSSISGNIADALAGEATCPETCAICLEQFVGGKDKVSWSKFQTCCHAFHQKCIAGWLIEMKNKDGSCPCCRGPYLKERLDTPDKNSHTSDAESNSEGERSDSATVQAQDEESIVDGASNADEERYININIQTSDEESNAGGAATFAMLEEDSLKKTKRNVVGSAEFTSFCIVHGLQKDDN